MLKCGFESVMRILGIFVAGLIVGETIFLVPAGFVSVTQEDDWPMLMRNPLHTGYTEGFGPADENVLWEYDFGSPLYSSPVVKNGTVYQGNREYLCALDADTGTLLWKTELAVVGSTPAVNKNILVAATNKGISAVDIGTGDTLWTYDIIDVSSHSKWAWEYYLSSPVIADDRVLVGSGTNFVISYPPPEDFEKFEKLLCLDIQSGTLVWSKDSKGYLSTSPAIKSNTVYFTSELVEAVDIESGREKWSEASGYFLPADPTIVKGFVVFANPDDVIAIDASSGKLVWRTKLESIASAIATDGTFLIGATVTSLICLDVDTGSLLWEKPLWTEVNEPIDFPQSSSPAIAKDQIYVGSRDGSVYCVNLEDGTLLWEYKTSGPVVASPAVVDGKMYIGSTGGKLYCFGTNPEEYFEKAEEYERKGNTERAQEFYIRAQEYYQSQGDLEMVKKCEDKLEGRSYLWVAALAGFCVIIIGALLIYRKMYKESM